MVTVTLHGQTVTLPDPLMMCSGEKVTSPDDWPSRRAEILELFRANVYGRAPVDRPDNLQFEVKSTSRETSGAIRKQITISYAGRTSRGVLPLVLVVPPEIARPAPCFVLVCYFTEAELAASSHELSDFWPVERLIARGYATAMVYLPDLAPDRKNSFAEGVHGLFDPPGPRAADAWGAIAAWSWGASRVMDYLQTDPHIDAARVALVGHSRGGKAALWAGAQDERFALTISNNSGGTGMALARGKRGEHIKDINTAFPYWFCENYKRYNDRENELPVDQHLLASLIAPRLLYVTSASEDEWADPDAEFASVLAASPVYRFSGVEALETNEKPPPQVPLHQGRIGYHIREGEHNLLSYDWEQFMNFADRHFPL